MREVDNVTVTGVAPLSPVMASKALQALSFIERYYAVHGIGPSLSEIAATLNSNRSRAQDIVRRLAREGRIHHVPGQPRGIRPVTADEEALRRLRAAGYIVTNAGLPLVAVLDHVPRPSGDPGTLGDLGQHGEKETNQTAGKPPRLTRYS